MDTGTIGAIAGSVAGILGAALGTYAGLRNATSSLERRYLIRCTVALSIGIGMFLAMLFLAPPPYRWLLWIPYAIALPLALLACGRQLTRIRVQADHSAPSPG